MEWTLERINGPKNFFVLDNNERSFTCGRSLKNKIVCPSLVVSREHCVFVRADNVISVIDLKSSNGIFVNGEQVKANLMIELHENDLIGIGSSDEYRDNEPMFLFRLHKGNLNARNLEEFEELLTQRSSSSSNFAGTPIMRQTSAEVQNEAHKPSLKRNLPAEIKAEDAVLLPPKVSKVSDGNAKRRENIPNKLNDSTTVPTKAKKIPEAEEIEEIWSTLSPPNVSLTKSNRAETSPVLADEKPESSLNRANRLTLDTNNENHGRKPVENKKTEASRTKSLDLERKEEPEGSKQHNSTATEKEKVKVQITEKAKSPLTEAVSVLTSPDNSHKTIRFSLDASSTGTRFTVDIVDSQDAGIQRTDKRSSRSNSENSEKQKERKTIPEAKKKCKKGPNKPEAAKKPTSKCTPTPENQNFAKPQGERLSFLNKQPVASSSPFKLKHIKREPMTSFSVIDTVDLSDDDDDVFPSSQLFDSTSENCSVKVKNEFSNLNTDDTFEDEEDLVKDRFADVDQARQESEEIITLSDSDDEENPWLQRLSESQRIKEEIPEKTEPDISEPESPPMEFCDELFALKPEWDEEFQTMDVQAPTTAEIQMKTPPPISMKHRRSLTPSEIERDISEDNEFNADTGQTSDTEKSNKSNDKSPDESPRKSLGGLKGPMIIEPLRLQCKRLSTKEIPDTSSSFDSTIPSTSKGHIGLKACSVEIPKLSAKLISKKKREIVIENRLKQKRYEEEQRIRRIKNKWAQNVPLPLGKRKSPTITKQQKLEIANERKEKLKALAEKQKAESVKPSVERVAAKPKAKISMKNRGDFLINDRKSRDDTSSNKTAAKSSTSSLESSEATSEPSKMGEPSTSEKIITKKESPVEKRSTTKSGSKTKSPSSLTRKKKEEKRSKSKENTDTSTLSTKLKNRTIEHSKELAINQKENSTPNSLDKNNKQSIKKTKKVSFSDGLVSIRVFEIDPGNTMKKCTGKDALIPKHKLANPKNTKKVEEPKLEEFLLHIFSWNPLWLEEQKRLQTDPPIIKYDTLIPLLTNYKSYLDYYQILMPLLLLELWSGITKEFETIDQNYRRKTVSCCVVDNSIGYKPVPSANTALTTMMLEVVASEDDVRQQIHPVYGDLVFLELIWKDNNGVQKFAKVFAYVTGFYKIKITQQTIFNQDLLKHTHNPSYVLRYTILTKALKVEVCMNRLFRLRCVTYLRANLRMVQALQFLPNSPLLHSILNPRIEPGNLSNPASNSCQSSLVTGDKLNQKQREAVLKTTEAVIQKAPKVCLIQGPPGTGKSEVIVNMVMQILYADDRYKNRDTSLRILLCAPSNAAIDTIVLRLLDRRAKLHSDRFKMVRVGLQSAMHPKVRNISLEELAKRDVRKTIASHQSCGGESMSSVEEEKRFLEAQINALQSKFNSSHRIDEKQLEYNRIKLAEMKARYELMKSCNQSNGSNIDHAKLQRGAESKILISADIIACTLSSCYTNIMESSFGGTKNNISVCIVDEATQSCEAETLIPLMLGVNTLVLVGDPAQLPATIISQKAKKFGLDQSLFSRTQRAFEGSKNSPVITLNVQYRMNAQICRWPNNYFYASKLQNGVNADGIRLPFHPYRVLNLTDSYQNPDKFSNTQEAEFVSNLIHSMIHYLDSKKFTSNVSVGVITPYKNQQNLVQTKINQRLDPIMQNLNVKVNVEVNTVDSFQGHERDIIIMSCVRTSGIGFLADRQRLCVALTRAKHCLILCGNFGTFQGNTMWRALLADARSRRIFIDVKANTRQSDIVSQLVK